ncbi:putative HECT domain, ubiquitin [Medicago truncatula]|uniref:HECT-type E3 ubiquitin transferase n=1 Tax=Medicago truncatula TaxID=3880 RepID=A0A396J5Q4_MEDTR|nr:putative HECT domain, ubiquitin [Medicago truncatula]
MSSITKTIAGGCFHQQSINGATADHLSNHSPELKFNDTKTTSSELQFFVRMMWKCNTIVIHASREDTVESILQQISSKTKIPIEYQRLIYNGKQLQQQQSLSQCGIENDANLQLVGQLRSIGRSVVWNSADDIVSMILNLCRGESLNGASMIIHNHFAKYMNNFEYFYFFKLMKIPSLLVALYMSPFACNKNIADFSIESFIEICLDLKCKKLQGFYLEILLDFCELLRGVGFTCDEPLYVSCRDGFGNLLTLVGGVPINNPNMKVLLRGVVDCVHEIADELLMYLDLSMNWDTAKGISYKVVLDFVKFCGPLRMGFAEEQATSDESLNYDICYEEDPLFSGVPDQLHIVFIKLLSKMDECLQVMEDCLVNKEQGKGDVIHNGWSHYLIILKELFHISKFYSGAQEKFWGLLLHRKNVLPHMIVRYVKKTDDHQWLLENKIVTDFESRRHLALMLFPDSKDEISGYEMLIDRSQVLAESFEYMSRAKAKSLQGGIFMAFKNEKATGPGVLREWFVLVCREIFNPKNALFVACPNDHRRFFPNAGEFYLDIQMHNFFLLFTLHSKYFSMTSTFIRVFSKET